MAGKTFGRVLAAGVLSIAASGCANQSKERMVLLEDANRGLTARLNRSSAEAAAAREDQQRLDRRLADALGEIDRLNQELANQPTPQAAAPGWTAVPGGAMIAIDAGVLFAPGRIDLRGESRRTLDGIVSTTQGEYADKDVLIIGHTDDRPIKKSGWQDNYQLSTERALAVVRYLKEHGVATSRLIAGGVGEFRPRASNASDAGRARNRRVEIFAITPVPHDVQP